MDIYSSLLYSDLLVSPENITRSPHTETFVALLVFMTYEFLLWSYLAVNNTLNFTSQKSYKIRLH